MRLLGGCVLAALGVGCTLFDGEEPQGAGGAGGSTADGGGGGVPSCVNQTPACLLPELEAVRMCARIAECPHLAGSIALSTGLPLAQLDENGARLSFSFSSCVDWLTAPIESAHLGYQAANEALNCVAATLDCTSAASCLSYALIDETDARCDGENGPSCDGSDLVDCAAFEVTRCDGASFPVATDCEDVPPPTCRIGSCDLPEITCEATLGVTYALACTAAGDEVGINCTAHGLGCSAGVGCSSTAGIAPTCDVPYAQACEGPVVTTCTTRSPEGLLTSRIDCAQMGGGKSCSAPGPSARCAGPSDACTPTDATIDVCVEGTDTILMCVGGQPREFDCKLLGMSCEGATAELSGRCRK